MTGKKWPILSGHYWHDILNNRIDTCKQLIPFWAKAWTKVTNHKHHLCIQVYCCQPLSSMQSRFVLSSFQRQHGYYHLASSQQIYQNIVYISIYDSFSHWVDRFDIELLYSHGVSGKKQLFISNEISPLIQFKFQRLNSTNWWLLEV